MKRKKIIEEYQEKLDNQRIKMKSLEQDRDKFIEKHLTWRNMSETKDEIPNAKSCKGKDKKDWKQVRKYTKHHRVPSNDHAERARESILFNKMVR